MAPGREPVGVQAQPSSLPAAVPATCAPPPGNGSPRRSECECPALSAHTQLSDRWTAAGKAGGAHAGPGWEGCSLERPVSRDGCSNGRPLQANVSAVPFSMNKVIQECMWKNVQELMTKESVERIAFLSHCNQIFMVLHENRLRGLWKRIENAAWWTETVGKCSFLSERWEHSWLFD